VALAIGVAAGTNGPSRHGGTEGHGWSEEAQMGKQGPGGSSFWRSVPNGAAEGHKAASDNLR